MKLVKKTIALLIRNPADSAQILAVKRERDDPEHPGVWGLPAGSFREGESTLDLIRRIGEDKLGLRLAPFQAVFRPEGTRGRPHGPAALSGMAVTTRLHFYSVSGGSTKDHHGDRDIA